MRNFVKLAAGLLALSTITASAGPFEDGVAAWRQGDYRAASNYWRPLAATDGTVQANYGIMYKDGKGVSRNYATAVQWFSRSAANGSSLGQNDLGGMYRDGLGVKRDYVKAITFFQAAAQQGNPAAQVNLGLMLLNGQGTQIDPVHAYMWFDLAAAQGVAQAVTDRNMARQRMTSRDLAMASQMSQRCRAQSFKGCA